MIAFVFNYGLTLSDVNEPLVPKDHVVVKPIKVAFNGIENAIYNGQIWVRPGTVIGGLGIVKVIEGGIESDWSSMAGKLAVVSLYSKTYGGVGSEINGIAAERAAVPEDSLLPYFEELGDLNALIPFASIAVKVAREAEGRRLLVIGYGVLSRLVVMASRGKADVWVYTESNKADMAPVVSNLEPSKWDVVFISTISAWPRVYFSAAKKLLMPRLMKSWPIINKDRVKFVEPEFDEEAVNLLKLNSEKLKEVLVYSDSFDSVIPVPKGKIVMVNAEKALRTSSP